MVTASAVVIAAVMTASVMTASASTAVVTTSATALGLGALADSLGRILRLVGATNASGERKPSAHRDGD